MTSPRHIISADNPLVRLVQRLVRDPLAYRTVGRCWIEGAHLCASFVAQGGTPAHAVIAQSAWSSQTLRALAQHGGEIVVLPDRLFERLSPLPSPAGLGFVIEVPALATALDPVPMPCCWTVCRMPATWAASFVARRRSGSSMSRR